MLEKAGWLQMPMKFYHNEKEVQLEEGEFYQVKKEKYYGRYIVIIDDDKPLKYKEDEDVLEQ